MWAGLDLVEAAVHTGRRAEAHGVRHHLSEARLDTLSPRLHLLSTAATALTADNDHTRERFERARSDPELEQWPFDLARVRLAYGERLRRLRETNAARDQLARAHDVFGNPRCCPLA